MAATTISPRFQIVIPKDVRKKLHLRSQQRLHVVEKGGVITLVPEVSLKTLMGSLKGMSKTDLREKLERLWKFKWEAIDPEKHPGLAFPAIIYLPTYVFDWE